MFAEPLKVVCAPRANSASLNDYFTTKQCSSDYAKASIGTLPNVFTAIML